MGEKTFSEIFDYAEKIATNKMWEILNNFQFYLNPYQPFPKTLALQEKEKFKIFLSSVTGLYGKTKDILQNVFEDKLDEMESNHIYIENETPIHNLMEIKKLIIENSKKSNNIFDKKLINTVLQIGSYDDFAKNILNEMLEHKREYDYDYVISHISL